MSLVSFNLGVEIGQLFVLGLVAPALWATSRYLLNERTSTWLLSVLIAHSSWHWMTDRASALSQFPWGPPVIDAAWLASATRWAMGVLILGGLAWQAIVFVRRLPGDHHPVVAAED